MGNLKFFATKDNNGKPRHVVVATSDEEDGMVSVELVGFHPDVSGMSRRGKKPHFSQPVAVSELMAMAVTDVPEDLQKKAVDQLAPAAEEEPVLVSESAEE